MGNGTIRKQSKNDHRRCSSLTYTKEGHYLVYLIIYNGGEPGEHVMLDMVKEKGKWVIDNMDFGNYTLRDMLQS